MAELKARNAELARDLETVRKVLPSLSSDLELVANLLADMRPMEPELEAGLPPQRESITMLIRPRGREDEIPWRMPIPE